MKIKCLFLVTAMIGFALSISAQNVITGRVLDAKYHDPLPGATVSIKGQTDFTITGLDGAFELEVSEDMLTIVFTFISFESQEIEVTTLGSTTNMGIIYLKESDITMKEIYVIADRAKERETPVAVSTIDRKEIEEQLGSRDVPLVMNNTPSVYATQSGGGAGDARINVRGFNQRNVAIMINGVPVNDMENGWVYWSNWDGISDAASSIQMQRGMSAVNLATPSIGGTMNIITSPTGQQAGGSAKVEYGTGNLMKTSLTGHTGMIGEKLALNTSLVYKQGDGIMDKAWTEAYAYYFGASYSVNKLHKLELFALGAPQRHGQNSYKQNVASYNTDFANKIGADSAVASHRFIEQGHTFNQTWAPISGYESKQYWNGKTHSRYSDDYMNVVENYFHKPLVNMNWYARWASNLTQYTTVYYSGGTGGGTGTFGKIYRRDADGRLGDADHKYSAGPSPYAFDFDTTIVVNQAPAGTYYMDKKPITKAEGESIGIMRNSVNNQWTVGALSKLQLLVGENIKAVAGVDWRTAKIFHFREVRDLMGGDYFIYKLNQFDISDDDYKKVLGDKIDYNFTNTVDWIGGYLQGEYSSDAVTAYVTGGYSAIKYSYTNHFVRAEADTTKELYAETKQLPGFQLKGGFAYRPITGLNIFVNYGNISKSPIFDNVINDITASVATDPTNELFNAVEGGIFYENEDKTMDFRANYYFTQWNNRTMSVEIFNPDGSEGYVFVEGMNQRHKGAEFEAMFQPVKYFRIGAFASFGNWVYTNNVSGQYKDYSTGNEDTVTYNYNVKNLKVGDAPQTQFGAQITVFPIKGLRIQADYRYYDNFYADWDPFTRTDEADISQVWKTPAYGIMDFHVSYDLPLKGKVGLSIFGHLFNALDEIYVQDATDNSKYNGYYGTENALSHTANSADVYLGLPRFFNAGLSVRF